MSIDLTVQQPLSATSQFIQDQDGNPSTLAISNSQVSIGTATPINPSMLTVSGSIGPGATAVILSDGTEASIAYRDNSGTFWTSGSGGEGPGLELGTFFFWNSQIGPTLTISPAGAVTLLAGGLNVPNGTVNVNQIQANSITATHLIVNVPTTPSSTAAPDPRRLVPLAVDPETGKIYLQR